MEDLLLPTIIPVVVLEFFWLQSAKGTVPDVGPPSVGAWYSQHFWKSCRGVAMEIKFCAKLFLECKSTKSG